MTFVGIEDFTLMGLLLITIIIIFYLAWMVKYKAKAKERLLLIEKDFDVNKLKASKKNSFALLKTGIVLFASSIGAVIAVLIFTFSSTPIGEEVITSTSIDDGVIFFISIFMFGGIGMIIANKVENSKKEN